MLTAKHACNPPGCTRISGLKQETRNTLVPNTFHGLTALFLLGVYSETYLLVFGYGFVSIASVPSRIQANTRRLRDALIADAGYCSAAYLEACEEKGLVSYISTSQQQHGHRPTPSRGRASRDLDVRGRICQIKAIHLRAGVCSDQGRQGSWIAFDCRAWRR